ncbi:4a-hydroxytetrahydrobiopterin dehydratase [Halovulum sp. GXIMD14793]
MNPRLIEDPQAPEGWTLAADGKSIHRSYKFINFRDAFAWMTACALVAEKLDHHPDWSNNYSSVEVGLSTHSAGGLTALDIDLAAEMDRLAHKYL